MKVLIDSSIWIDYFKSGQNSGQLDDLINENLIVINDLILAELIPFLLLKKQSKIVHLLKSIENIPITINWKEIMALQEKLLKKGISGIGIPDLIIAQNAQQNDLIIYTLDKHFEKINTISELKIFTDN